MAHQWFGDLLTMADWRGIWLHESFAVYFTDMYFENFHGTDEFKKRRLDQNRKYIKNQHENDPMEKVKFKGNLVPVDFGSYKCYNRGGAILHELRYELGDALFQQGIRAYVKKYAFQTVTSQDFREVMEETSGHDLTQWFKQWIYGAGHPQFKVSYEWDETAKIITLHVKQTQLETEVLGVFEVTVPVEIRAGKTRIQRRLQITKRGETFCYRLPQAPNMVRFDVGNHVLKELDFHKSLAELKYQLFYDEDMIGRLLAAEQLAEYKDNAVPVLERAYQREDFYAVRQAIAKSLGEIASPAALEVLKMAAQDNDSRVRESVMEALGNFDAKAGRPLLVNALQNDYNDYVRGAAAHSMGIVKADSAFEILAAALSYPSSNQRIQIGIFEGFRELQDARVLPLAKEYVKYKYSSGGAHKLEPVILNFANDMSVDYRAQALVIMLEGIKNPFFRTYGKAAELLQDLKATETIPELKKALETIQRPRSRRTIEGTIKKLQ
ncbi:HEAT repeat domain-containing protein, partial [bacterium]|nr:HEAT repeat domain-containing protein [bacterium]